MGLWDGQPVHPHGVHRRVCTHEFLSFQELHILRVQVCGFKPPMAVRSSWCRGTPPSDWRSAKKTSRDMKKKFQVSAMVFASTFSAAVAFDGLTFAIASSPSAIHFANTAADFLASATALANALKSLALMALWMSGTSEVDMLCGRRSVVQTSLVLGKERKALRNTQSQDEQHHTRNDQVNTKKEQRSMCVNAGIVSHSVPLKCACRDPPHRQQKTQKRDGTTLVVSCTVAADALSWAQDVFGMQYADEAGTNLQWSRTCPVDGQNGAQQRRASTLTINISGGGLRRNHVHHQVTARHAWTSRRFRRNL